MADFLVCSSFIIAENYRDTEALPMSGAQMGPFQASLMRYFCFQKGQVHVLQNAPAAPVAKAHTVQLGALPPSLRVTGESSPTPPSAERSFPG